MKKYSEKGPKIGKIMEIKVNSTSKSEVLTRVEDFISDSHRFYIVTPNPEIILASIKNEKLKKALNGADLSISDGVGLKVAIPGLKIIKGRELFLNLMEVADKNKWRVFLLGGTNDEANLTAKKLKIKYKNVSILSDKGPRLNKNAKSVTKVDKKLETEAIASINRFEPQLLFVAFGNPKQEIWVSEHLSHLKIGGAMCVGGTFRYIAGLSKLPPKWIGKIGLEWLWRVITEPKRIGRIFRAVVVFPIRHFIYRANH